MGFVPLPDLGERQISKVVYQIDTERHPLRKSADGHQVEIDVKYHRFASDQKSTKMVITASEKVV